MINSIRSFLSAILLCGASAAHALSATGPFVISQIYISGAENYHVRVSGFPAISACPSATTWVYINQSASGSKEYIAALMLAYATGKPVNILWQPDANGFCQIIELIS